MGKLRFGYKLMLSYLVLVTIPILIIGIFSYTTYVHSTKEQTKTIIQEALFQMRENVVYKLEDTVRISNILYYDHALARYLRNYKDNWDSYEGTHKYLLPKLQSTISATDRNIWLSLYFHNEFMPEIYYTHDANVDPLSFKNGLYEVYHTKRIEDKDWYIHLPAEKYGVTKLWMQVEEDQKHNNISLIRRLVDANNPAGSQIVGSMRITMKIQELFQSIDYSRLGEGSSILVLDDQQHIKFTSQTNEFALGERWDPALRADHLVIEERLPGLDWSMIALIPNEVFSFAANKVRNVTLFVCLGSLVGLTLLGAVVARYFSTRVTKIVAVLDAFQDGDFDRRVKYKGKDEFAKIASSLNELGSNMTDLIQKVYVANIQKNEAELETLQAQINPHFLYNTLSSISRMAKLGEIEKLELMVQKLAQFYRLTLNKGEMMTSVDMELQHVKAYLEIQGIKYAKRMTVTYHIDPDVMSYRTVKLILQPFVENVLEHAWYGDRIHIRIVACAEDATLVFQIIDDGVGISRELLPQLFAANDGVYLGYGIRNVDQRIKLYFGAQYGVSIFSRPGIGTSVKITIPKV